MKTSLILTIFLIFLGSFKTMGQQEYKVPSVIDTFKARKIERTIIRWISEADYYPFYIGKYHDTIFTTYSETSNLNNIFDERTRNYLKPDSTEILIVVDTNTQMANYSDIWWVDSGTIQITQTYNAYPVIVSNKTKDTLNIAHRFKIPLILEALDKDGIWKILEVEHLPQYSYTKSFNALFLPPNEILITTVPISYGNFHTKLRLRYNHILSNEFHGTIYLTQFENEYDKHWNKKSLPKE